MRATRELCRAVATTLVLLLAPYAPHWADELWTEALGNEGSAYDVAWPSFDEEATKADEVERAVMIGGKVRGPHHDGCRCERGRDR